ncbi:MAG: ABC transporter substrate-binding protein [Ruminiclostridium sp.]
MAQKIKIFPMALVIIMLVVGVFGCGASEEVTKAKEDVPIRYIINNLGSVSTIEIAMEKGFFKEDGVKLETVGVAGGGALSIQAVLSGDADLSAAPFPTEINAVKNGSKLKIIYGGASSSEKNPGTNWITLKDSGINSAKDLVGKTIAMGALGAIWEYGTREYLKQSGLSSDQVTIVVVPPTQHEQVLKGKQADVVVTDSPVADNILADGKARILTTTYSILGIDGAAGGYEMRQDFTEKNPELVKKLVTALVKADQWIEANPEDARTIVAKVLKERDQNPDLAKYWKPSHLNNYGQLSDKNANFWIDWFVQDGKLKEGEIKPSDVYTNEFNPYFKK